MRIAHFEWLTLKKIHISKGNLKKLKLRRDLRVYILSKFECLSD